MDYDDETELVIEDLEASRRSGGLAILGAIRRAPSRVSVLAVWVAQPLRRTVP
jgi:hypothetical protein